MVGEGGGGSATLSMGRRLHVSVCHWFALQGEKGVVECAYVEGDGDARFFSQPLCCSVKWYRRA